MTNPLLVQRLGNLSFVINQLSFAILRIKKARPVIPLFLRVKIRGL
jgi:hypothetical protein